MGDLLAAAGSGIGVGVAYGLLAVAAALATRATRTLHLALGPAVVVGAMAHLVLVADGRLPVPLAVLAGLAVGALASAALEPLVLGRVADGAGRLVGAFVLGAVLVTLAARTLGARTVRPRPLLDAAGWLGPDGLAVGPVSVPAAAVGALVLGLPVALVLAAALSRTRWGARARLVGSSAEAARQGGLRPARIRVGVLAVAGAAGTWAALLAAPLTLLGVPQAAGLTLRAVAAALVVANRPLPALGVGVLLGMAEAMAQATVPAVGADATVAAVVLAALLLRGGVHSRSWGRAW